MSARTDPQRQAWALHLRGCPLRPTLQRQGFGAPPLAWVTARTDHAWPGPCCASESSEGSFGQPVFCAGRQCFAGSDRPGGCCHPDASPPKTHLPLLSICVTWNPPFYLSASAGISLLRGGSVCSPTQLTCSDSNPRQESIKLNFKYDSFVLGRERAYLIDSFLHLHSMSFCQRIVLSTHVSCCFEAAAYAARPFITDIFKST